MRLLSLCALVLSLFSACSHLTAEECRRADWFQRGRLDAISGEDDDNLQSYQQACAKSGGVNLARFEAGRAEGLEKFCTEEQGYRYGLQGDIYQGFCPPEARASFTRGQQAGQREYLRRQKEKELEEREVALKRKERRLLEELQEKEEALKAKEAKLKRLQQNM